MAKQIVNYNELYDYIKIGHTATSTGSYTYNCSDLQNIPSSAKLGRTLHDLDKDGYTDLKGRTHRNRVRHDVEDIEVVFPILSVEDRAYILNLISPAWVYVEIPDAKTLVETKDANNYIKYLRKTDEATFWYDSTNNRLYNASYQQVSPFTLSDYKKYLKNDRKTVKMYASDKQWDTFIIYKDSQNNWQTEDVDLTFSLIQE